MRNNFIHFTLAAHILQFAAAQQNCVNTLHPNYNKPVVAGGWTYRLIASGFTRPRSIIFDQKGALLLVDSRIGIVHTTFEDYGGTCLSVSEKKVLIDSPDVGYASKVVSKTTS
jgi:hypothetical protein